MYFEGLDNITVFKHRTSTKYNIKLLYTIVVLPLHSFCIVKHQDSSVFGPTRNTFTLSLYFRHQYICNHIYINLHIVKYVVTKLKHDNLCFILSDVIVLALCYSTLHFSVSKKKENGYSHPTTSVVRRDFKLAFL